VEADYNNLIYIHKIYREREYYYSTGCYECIKYYYIPERQNTIPHTSLVFSNWEANILPHPRSLIWLLLWYHLRAETAKLCCFITYNNMGSKTVSTECTFASLTRQREKTLNDMPACGIQGKDCQDSKTICRNAY
jgi:hypothetical protein